MKCKSTKKKPDLQNLSVKLPKDAVWRLFGKMLDDLEVCHLDAKLHAAIRGRKTVELLDAISRYDARSIIERLGTTPASVTTFGKLYQVGALIKKFPFPGNDTYSPALKSFNDAEEQCRLFNTQNFRALIALSKNHPKYYGLLEDLRKEIYDLIGDTPNIEEVYVRGMHGPGQTAGGQFKGGCVTSFFKYTTLPYTVSTSALTYAQDCILRDPRWIGGLMDYYRTAHDIPQWKPIDMEHFWESVLVIQDTSEITSVPKTALTDRFIAMEPTFNVFLQLGVDRVLREKLLTWGYDLNSQELNQELARLGSIFNDKATIDLKAASDTISLMICFLLLPPGWMNLLLDLRMEKGIIVKDKTLVKFSKMSSMGNGFTFVLESLIFGACSRVAMKRSGCKGKSAVYGDDIVLPSKAVSLLYEILDLCGFKVNAEKSFTEGPFRESCGADFFLGYNVRPFFITDNFSDVPSLFHLHNSFMLQQKKWEFPWNHTFERSIKLILSWIPDDFRQYFRGPISESTDTYLFTEEPLLTDKDGYRYHRTLIERPTPFRLARKVGYNTFHLRKMCVSLFSPEKPITTSWLGTLIERERPFERWDWRKKFGGGNAYEIYTRDRTYYKCARSYRA